MEEFSLREKPGRLIVFPQIPPEAKRRLKPRILRVNGRRIGKPIAPLYAIGYW
jgi:hypothetical protein